MKPRPYITLQVRKLSEILSTSPRGPPTSYATKSKSLSSAFLSLSSPSQFPAILLIQPNPSIFPPAKNSRHLRKYFPAFLGTPYQVKYESFSKYLEHILGYPIDRYIHLRDQAAREVQRKTLAYTTRSSFDCISLTDFSRIATPFDNPSGTSPPYSRSRDA